MEAVILAAGYSSRAGGYKMEMVIEGKPVLHHVIDAFVGICTKIIVVGGYKIDCLRELVEPYGDGVTLVFNEVYEQGMFSSVKCGISQVSSKAFFLTPGDYPMLNEKIVRQLMEGARDDEKILIPVFKGRGGHPVLIPSAYIKDILNMPHESNLKAYFDLCQHNIKRIELDDPGILYDLDTPADYQQLIERMK